MVLPYNFCWRPYAKIANKNITRGWGATDRQRKSIIVGGHAKLSSIKNNYIFRDRPLKCSPAFFCWWLVKRTAAKKKLRRIYKIHRPYRPPNSPLSLIYLSITLPLSLLPQSLLPPSSASRLHCCRLPSPPPPLATVTSRAQYLCCIGQQGGPR